MPRAKTGKREKTGSSMRMSAKRSTGRTLYIYDRLGNVTSSAITLTEDTAAPTGTVTYNEGNITIDVTDGEGSGIKSINGVSYVDGINYPASVPNISIDNIDVQVYYGEISENGMVENINIKSMELMEEDAQNKVYIYETPIELKTGGNYGYTFRVMPKSNMLLDSENLNLVKWVTK